MDVEMNRKQRQLAKLMHTAHVAPNRKTRESFRDTAQRLQDEIRNDQTAKQERETNP